MKMAEPQMSIRARRRNADRIFLQGTKMVVACSKILPYRHPSDVVQYLRLGEGLTVEEVAKKLNVSQETVRRWTPPDLVWYQVKKKQAG